MSFNYRLAVMADITALKPLMDAAIDELLKPYLSAEQVAASHAVMGLDTQLIADGTYFVIAEDGRLAGCGGWSRRATLFGGDHSVGREARLLDPASEPARVRAMYTHPSFTRGFGVWSSPQPWVGCRSIAPAGTKRSSRSRRTHRRA